MKSELETSEVCVTSKNAAQASFSFSHSCACRLCGPYTESRTAQRIFFLRKIFRLRGTLSEPPTFQFLSAARQQHPERTEPRENPLSTSAQAERKPKSKSTKTASTTREPPTPPQHFTCLSIVFPQRVMKQKTHRTELKTFMAKMPTGNREAR